MKELTEEEDITPWEALLRAVRQSASRTRWVDQQLAQAVARHDGESAHPEVRGWLAESRKERNQMARMAKAAIDAGIAERVVRQVEVEGRAVAAAVAAAIDRLELSAEQRMLAIEAAHERLLSGPDGEPNAVIEGTILPETTSGTDGATTDGETDEEGNEDDSGGQDGR